MGQKKISAKSVANTKDFPPLHDVPEGFVPAASASSVATSPGVVNKTSRRKNTKPAEATLVDENYRPIEELDQSQVIPEIQEEGIPEWMQDELQASGLDPEDFASPRAASRILNQIRASRVPQFIQAPQQPATRQEEKAFDPFEGVDRKKVEDELGETGKHLLSVIERVHKNSDERVKSAINEVHQARAEANNTRQEAIDTQFETLNEKYDGAFGEGSIQELAPHSVEYKNRQDAYQMAISLIQAGRATSVKAALGKAAKAILGDAVPAKKSVKQSAKEVQIAARSSQSLGFSQASNRVGDTAADHKQKALKAIQATLYS